MPRAHGERKTLTSCELGIPTTRGAVPDNALGRDLEPSSLSSNFFTQI